MKKTKNARRFVLCLALTIATFLSVLYQIGIIGEKHKTDTVNSSDVATVSVPDRTMSTLECWEYPSEELTESAVNVRPAVVKIASNTLVGVDVYADGTNEVSEPEAVEPEVLATEVSDYSYFFSGTAPEKTYVCSDADMIADFQQLLADYEAGDVDVPVLERYLYEDEYLLAAILDCEAGGTHDLNELLCVGWTVLSRRSSNVRDFRNVTSIHDVVAQSGQYPTTYRKIQNGHGSTDICRLAAHILFTTPLILAHDQNGTWYVLGDDLLFQTGFHPSWDVYEIFETEYHVYSGE